MTPITAAAWISAASPARRAAPRWPAERAPSAASSGRMSAPKKTMAKIGLRTMVFMPCMEFTADMAPPRSRPGMTMVEKE